MTDSYLTHPLPVSATIDKHSLLVEHYNLATALIVSTEKTTNYAYIIISVQFMQK